MKTSTDAARQRKLKPPDGGFFLFQRGSIPLPEGKFEPNHQQRQSHDDGIGDDDGKIILHDPIDQPGGNVRQEDGDHPGGEVSYGFRRPGFINLRQKCDGGKESPEEPEIVDPLKVAHGVIFPFVL